MQTRASRANGFIRSEGRGPPRLERDPGGPGGWRSQSPEVIARNRCKARRPAISPGEIWRAARMAPIVSIKNVVKEYTLGKVVVPALRGVNLEVFAGEFISIA